MTNNLKCPFCSAELDYARDSFGNILTNRFFCPNSTCIAFGDQATAFLWTKIIDGKKAQDALKKAKEIYVRDIAYWEQRDLSTPDISEIERFFDKEITSITKQENE